MPKKKKRSTQDTSYDKSLLDKMKRLEDKEPAPQAERSKMQKIWRAKELREKREAEAAINPKMPKSKPRFPKKIITPSSDDVHRMAQAHSQIVNTFEHILGDQESGTGYGILQEDSSEEYQSDLAQLTELLDSHILSYQDKITIKLILSALNPPTVRGYGDALFALSPTVLEGLTKFKLTKVAKTVGINKPDTFSSDELVEVLSACLNPDLRSLILLRQFAEYYLSQQGEVSEEGNLALVSGMQMEVRDLNHQLRSMRMTEEERAQKEERSVLLKKQIEELRRSTMNEQSSLSLERCWETFGLLPNVIQAIRFKKIVEKKDDEADKELAVAKYKRARMTTDEREAMADIFGEDSSDDEDRAEPMSDGDSDASIGEDSMIPPEGSEPLPGVGSERARNCDFTSRQSQRSELKQLQIEIDRSAEVLKSAQPEEKKERRQQYVELIHQRRELLKRIQGCNDEEVQKFKVGEEALYIPLNEVVTITGFSRTEGCIPPYIISLSSGDEERAWSNELRLRDGSEILSADSRRKTKAWNPDSSNETGEDSIEDSHLSTLRFYDETQGTVIDIAPRTSAFYDQDNVPADCISMYKNPPWIKQSVRTMYVRFVDPVSFNQTSEFLNPSPVNLIDTALKNNVRIPARIVGLVTNSALNGREATLIGLEGDNAYKVEITQNQVKRVVRLAKTNVDVPDIYKGDWYRPTKLYFALQCYRLRDKKQEGNVFSGSIDLEPVGTDSDSSNTTRLSMEICYRTAVKLIFQDEEVWNAEKREHERKRQTSYTKLEKLLSQPINEASIAFTVNSLSRILSGATGTNIYNVDSSGDPLKLKDGGDHARSYVRIATECMVSICRQSTDTIKCLLNQLARIAAFINMDKKDNKDQIFISRLRQESYAPEVLCTLSDEEMAPAVFLGPNTDAHATDIFNRHLTEEIKVQENHFAVRFYRSVNPNDQMIKEKEGEMWSTIPHLVSLAPWIDHQCKLKELGEDPAKIVYYKPSDGAGPECFKIDDIIQNKISGDTRPPEFTEFLDNIKRIYGPFEKFRTMKPREDKPVYQGNRIQKNAVLALFQMVGLESWRAHDLPPVPQLISEWERNYQGMWSMLTAKFGSELARPPKIPSAIIAPGLFSKMRERLSACIARSQSTVIQEPHGHENWIEARATWDQNSRVHRKPKTQSGRTRSSDKDMSDTRPAGVSGTTDERDRMEREDDISDGDSDREEPMIADSDSSAESDVGSVSDLEKDDVKSSSSQDSPRLDCVKCGKQCTNKRITFPYMSNNSVSMLHFCNRSCAERTTHFE